MAETVAFLFADLAGSTRLVTEIGAGLIRHELESLADRTGVTLPRP